MERINCPLCRSLKQDVVILSKEDEISEDVFKIMQCHCGFKFLNPRPSSLEISKYYSIDTYHPHKKGSGIIYLMFRLSRWFTYRWKMRLIKQYSNGEPIHLDYGSGDGSLSNHLKKCGVESYSYDPISNDGNHLPSEDKKINIITLWHSLEHIHNLDNFFSTLSNMPDAKVIVAVPNYNAFERKYFKDSWAAFDLPRHLYHFDSTTLLKLFNKYEYNIIDKKKMILDTIYISLLSKKEAKIGYLNLFRIMFLATVKVIYNNPDSSSSLLYVFEKRN